MNGFDEALLYTTTMDDDTNISDIILGYDKSRSQ